MVKNLKGGKGHKSIARKSIQVPTNRIRIPENPLELFAVVTKFYGNLCDVTTHDNLELKCHIRGKFKGKSKRNAFIAVGKIILIGLRHYETTPKNCDLLHVYETTTYAVLHSMTSYNLNQIFSMSSSLSSLTGSSSTTAAQLDHDLLFGDEPDIDDITPTSTKTPPPPQPHPHPEMGLPSLDEENEELYIDDI